MPLDALMSEDRADDWWVEVVLSEFAFVKEYGFELTGSRMAGVHLHFKGDFIWFERPDGRYVVFSYDPWEGGSHSATVGTGKGIWDTRPLDVLIAENDPNVELMPPSLETTRPEIERKVKWWAAKVRAIGPQALGVPSDSNAGELGRT